MLKIVTCAGALCFASISDAKVSSFQTVGDWSIFQTDDTCALQKQERQGTRETTLVLSRFSDGLAIMSLKDKSWSIKEGEQRKVIIAFDDDIYNGGSLSTADHMLSMPVDAAGVRSFAKAKYVTVFLKIDDDHEVPLTQLSLEKSGTALAGFERCMTDATARRSVAKAESDRIGRYDRFVLVDPFATPVIGAAK